MMRTYIIVLNWNGWKDTIECLESLSHLDYPDFRIVVCDNHSNDGSLQRIKDWALGKVGVRCSNPDLMYLSSPPCPKPIPYLELTKQQSEAVNQDHRSGLVLIQTGANLGYAGGNNVGVRYALNDPSCEFVWLLNNDTVVDPDALSAMVALMCTQSEIGLCGSLNLSYYNAGVVQAQGGKTYSVWTGRVQAPPLLTIEDIDSHPAQLDFVNGASTLAHRSFLEKVGMMDESYFLYFEELDWAMRARGISKLGYARDSVIYHKEGAALGSNPDRMKRSLLSERYLSRNRVLFTKRFVPWALPTVLVTVILASAYRMFRGDPKRAYAMLICMFLGLCNRPIPLELECNAE